MFVENIQPNTRAIGGIYLNPGINEVDDKVWDKVMSSGYQGPVDKLIDLGILKIQDPKEKINVAMVEKTYDLEILESWLLDARGPLKGAIRKQLKMMEPKDGDK